MNELLLSLIAGTFIGGAGGYLGSLMLSKRMALVAGPLGHLTLPGIALAFLYHFDPSLGAFPFVILGIFFIWMLELKTKLPMEAITAIVFVTGVATAFLFLPINQVEAALVGDITKVSLIAVIVSVLISVVLFIVAKVIYSDMLLINISEDLSRANGIKVTKLNLIYLLLIAIIVALGVRMVGGLLTAALVAIPPSTARNLSQNLHQYRLGSLGIGALSSFIGILLFNATGLPAGPLIILVSALFFIVSIFFKNSAS